MNKLKLSLAALLVLGASAAGVGTIHQSKASADASQQATTTAASDGETKDDANTPDTDNQNAQNDNGQDGETADSPNN